MTTEGDAPIGCPGVAALFGITLVVVWIGWFAYDRLKPRPALVVLLQGIVDEAPVSDHFKQGAGWDEANVTAQVCPKAVSYTHLTLPTIYSV